jgi:hypothetical protein
MATKRVCVGRFVEFLSRMYCIVGIGSVPLPPAKTKNAARDAMEDAVRCDGTMKR